MWSLGHSDWGFRCFKGGFAQWGGLAHCCNSSCRVDLRRLAGKSLFHYPAYISEEVQRCGPMSGHSQNGSELQFEFECRHGAIRMGRKEFCM